MLRHCLNMPVIRKWGRTQGGLRIQISATAEQLSGRCVTEKILLQLFTCRITMSRSEVLRLCREKARRGADWKQKVSSDTGWEDRTGGKGLFRRRVRRCSGTALKSWDFTG